MHYLNFFGVTILMQGIDVELLYRLGQALDFVFSNFKIILYFSIFYMKYDFII